MADATQIMAMLTPKAYTGLTEHAYNADKLVKPAAAPMEQPAANADDGSGDKPKRGRPPKIPLTLDTLRDELARQGISVRLNLVTRCLDFTGIPEGWGLNPETLIQDFPVMLHDMLKVRYSGTLDYLKQLISVIGGLNQNRYNPVLDYIEAEPWDGQDYLSEFLRILGILDDELSQSLVCSWLLQAVALLNNDLDRRYSADGMLVLQGKQGIGKTTVAVVLGMRPEWTLTSGRLDAIDKDTLIRLTSHFISELGELDGSFKRTDAARMKAFITCESDHFRRPYGAGDTVQVRRTSLIGTVNDPRFLIDTTGNRRYWTVPLERINIPALRHFNAVGLWRQVLAGWREQDANGCGGDCYRLTPWQREQLDERNKLYRVAVRAEDEVADIFAEAEKEPDNFEWRNTTVSEFKLLNVSLSRYSVTAISKALDALGHEMKRTKTNGKV